MGGECKRRGVAEEDEITQSRKQVRETHGATYKTWCEKRRGAKKKKNEQHQGASWGWKEQKGRQTFSAKMLLKVNLLIWAELQWCEMNNAVFKCLKKTA